MRAKIIRKYILLFIVTVLLIGIWWFSKSNPSSKQNTSIPTPSLKDKISEIRKNSKELVSIADKEDPRKALEELQHRMDNDPLVFSNCHELAHEIGHEAIKRYKDFGTALLYQDNVCSDGYLHGIIEETFGESLSNVAGLITKMQKLCESLHGISSRCFHGVGHAMMYYTDSELPKALSLCGTLIGGMPRGKCYEGSYMQNFLAQPDLHPSNYVNYKNPMRTCQSTATRYKSYCYFYSPILYLNQNQNNYAQALQWCDNEKSAYAGTCARGVGSLIVKYNVKDPKIGQNLCSVSHHVKDCISGMVSYGLTFYANMKDVTEKICNGMDDAYKSMCMKSLHDKVYLF